MTSISAVRNIAAYPSVKQGTANFAAVAGGTGDATAVTGVAQDRLALNFPKSAVAVITWNATLTAAKTLSVGNIIEHSDNNSDWTTYDTLTSAVVASATGANAGQTRHDVDLTSAKRYVRMTPTPNLSHTGTDTMTGAGTLVFGGEERLAAV